MSHMVQIKHKKVNEEIVDRMKMAINVKKDIDLTMDSDITKTDSGKTV